MRTQGNNHGVLVLSEFAGAAQSLGAGSILVNPWNISDMSAAIAQARALARALHVPPLPFFTRVARCFWARTMPPRRRADN